MRIALHKLKTTLGKITLRLRSE